MPNLIEHPKGCISPESLAALERTRNIELPCDYKSFLIEYGGGRLVENIVDSTSGSDQHFEIVSFYGVEPDDGVLFSDLDSIQSCYEDSVPDDLFVIGRDWGGNMFTLQLKSPHSIYWWDHETGDRVQIAKNFSDLLERIIPTTLDEPECDFSSLETLSSDWKSEYGRSICECAAMHGRTDIVKQWAKLGRPFGESMRFAAMNSELRVVDLLISLGEDINILCHDGRTPLDWASYAEDKVPPLKQRGALLSSELTT